MLCFIGLSCEVGAWLGLGGLTVWWMDVLYALG